MTNDSQPSQEVPASTRQTEIEMAALEGTQIGGLDSAAGAANEDPTT